jgi:hypothetical protein
MSIHQLLQQFHVLVIDIHRSWTFAIDVQGVLTRCSRFGFGFSSVSLI